ncbi:MAG: hypothetical protein EOM50_14955 [Erysipelotrichia bacterium]|nr:hypothetical protein [Erysipelotrichia bacterium]NCC55346.1 hypothetical protein [Erysipelotrichia bacterium]
MNKENINKWKKRSKKVDLKISKQKYSLTFNEHTKHTPRLSKPVVLGMNGRNELRVMVNSELDLNEKEGINQLVEQIKTSFIEYFSDIKNKPFKPFSFDEIVFQSEEQWQSTPVEVEVQADCFIVRGEQTNIVEYQKVLDIYMDEKRDLSKSSKTTTTQIMNYVIVYERWIMIETEDMLYRFSGNQVDELFSLLSKAFFFAQMKKQKENSKNGR